MNRWLSSGLLVGLLFGCNTQYDHQMYIERQMKAQARARSLGEIHQLTQTFCMEENAFGKRDCYGVSPTNLIVEFVCDGSGCRFTEDRKEEVK